MEEVLYPPAAILFIFHDTSKANVFHICHAIKIKNDKSSTWGVDVQDIVFVYSDPVETELLDIYFVWVGL